MRNIIGMVLFILIGAFSCTAQTAYKTNANGELVQQATIHTLEQMEKGSAKTGQKFVASNGEKYDVYSNNNTGRLFIIRVSKTGNNYRQYLESAAK